MINGQKQTERSGGRKIKISANGDGGGREMGASFFHFRSESQTSCRDFLLLRRVQNFAFNFEKQTFFSQFYYISSRFLLASRLLQLYKLNF
jgi:hypothetical protein